MGIPDRADDIVAVDTARLTNAYVDQANVSGLLSVFLARQQELETQLWAVITSRLLGVSRAYEPDPSDPDNEELATLVEVVLDSADAHLDTVGALVGESRLGRSDEEYLVAIRIRILVNKSRGLATNLLQIAAQSLPLGQNATYTEPSTATFQVTALNFDGAPTLARMLGQAKMGGVRGVLVYSQIPQEQTFIWASDAGASTGDVSGFTSVYGGTLDSRYAGVLEATP
jgi:hypothetical protein